MIIEKNNKGFLYNCILKCGNLSDNSWIKTDKCKINAKTLSGNNKWNDFYKEADLVKFSSPYNTLNYLFGSDKGIETFTELSNVSLVPFNPVSLLFSDEVGRTAEGFVDTYYAWTKTYKNDAIVFISTSDGIFMTYYNNAMDKYPSLVKINIKKIDEFHYINYSDKVVIGLPNKNYNRSNGIYSIDNSSDKIDCYVSDDKFMIEYTPKNQFNITSMNQVEAALRYLATVNKFTDKGVIKYIDNQLELPLHYNFSERIKKSFGKVFSKLKITQYDVKKSLDRLVSDNKSKELPVVQFKTDKVAIYLPDKPKDAELVEKLDHDYAGENTELGVFHVTTKKLDTLLDRDVQVFGTYSVANTNKLYLNNYIN